jgi:hypothetical protein
MEKNLNSWGNIPIPRSLFLRGYEQFLGKLLELFYADPDPGWKNSDPV